MKPMITSQFLFIMGVTDSKVLRTIHNAVREIKIRLVINVCQPPLTLNSCMRGVSRSSSQTIVHIFLLFCKTQIITKEIYACGFDITSSISEFVR